MAFVILQQCCNDASCVSVCPVDCIHPTPDEAPFMRTEMLHIQPDVCIDCGACMDECPVDAIRPDDQLELSDQPYKALNAEYFDLHPIVSSGNRHAGRPRADYSGLRVAIVGSGPAACYSALDLAELRGARVTMFEKLLTPFGLVRFGVAPDHQSTKAVTKSFQQLARKKNFTLSLGVEVGMHLSHEELLEHHDAVIYAVGASSDRALGIPGEDLAGSHTATEFVAWYNGHPDYADRSFDLSGERVVVVGNGNVALDVARILLADPKHLEQSDIAEYALEALRASNVREVVVLGRRGVAQAAYTNPEMLGLRELSDVDLIIDPDEVAIDELTQSIIDADDTEASVRSKVRIAQEVAAASTGSTRKRLVLRYLSSPDEIAGDGRVEAIRVRRNRLERESDGSVMAVGTDAIETIPTGMVLRAVGYRGVPTPGVPFDESRGVIPNVQGRVIDPETREPIPGVYVTGWIKRGPSGVIGSNKKCAADTIDHLLEDFQQGILTSSAHAPEELDKLIRRRQPDAFGFAAWTIIDRAEKAAGKGANRPRVKMVDRDDMLALVRAEAGARTRPVDGR